MKIEIFLKKLMTDSPMLISLDLYFCEINECFNNACLRAVKRKSMQSINLDFDINGITHEGVIEFIKKSPSLREIVLPRTLVNEEAIRHLADFCPNLVDIAGSWGYDRSFETVRYVISKLTRLYKIECKVKNTEDFIQLFRDMESFLFYVTNLTIFCDFNNDGACGNYVEPFFRKFPKIKALRILDRNGKNASVCKEICKFYIFILIFMKGCFKHLGLACNS